MPFRPYLGGPPVKCWFDRETQNKIDNGAMVTVEGTVIKERFRNESTGVACLVIELSNNGTGRIPVIGGVSPLPLNTRVTATGIIVNDPKWGLQMPKALIELAVVNSREGVVRYLVSEVPGLGNRRANRLYDAYGEDTLTVLAEDPERVAREVRGISPALAESVSQAAAIQTHSLSRDILLFCLNLGLSHNNAMDISAKYAGNYRAVITENPYRLINDIRGIGFRKADQVAMALGIPADSRFRVGAAILETLKDNEQPGGNIYIGLENLINRVSALLSTGSTTTLVTNSRIAEVLRELRQDEKVYVKMTEDGNPANVRVYLMESWLAEQFIAKRLMEIAERPLPNGFDESTVRSRLNSLESELTQIGYPELDPDQKKAVITALTHPVSVITGGPGVGKTTILKYVSEYLQRYALQSVVLCAPTGKAAKRMSEQAEMPAYTIHRYFKTSGMELPMPDNPLARRNGTYIIDESSMLTERLLCSLLNHVAPGVRLILVGDKDQLPSIGAGQVLNDIINSQAFPVSFLTKIHRQAEDSHVITCAHAINDRGYVDLSSQYKDFAFGRVNQANSQNAVRILYQAALEKGYTPEDIQVLSPFRDKDKSEVSADAINEFLQPIVNPAAEDKPEYVTPKENRVFRVGDKVMQSANDYTIQCFDIDNPEEMVEKGVFNGETGTITDISDEEGCIYVNFGDRLAAYDFSNLFDLKLAYAMSIHKSQGSEYKLVILPVTRGASRDFYTRNMLYTAVTRASKSVILLGDPAYFRDMARNASASKRLTSLDEMLKELDLGQGLSI